MSVHNPLNVYSGKDALRKYFDPDYAPMLPLVEIPDEFNPYREDGVRIYAKMMTMLPANNVKALPAMNLLDQCVKPGKTKTVIEYSSGSTVISMSMVSRVFHGIKDVRAYMSNKTSETKIRLMQFFGLHLTLFPGPSQPEPDDARGGIQFARHQSDTDESMCNPNQYEHDANWKSHQKWTGPQILKQLPEVNVVCIGVGTSGTMTGTGIYLGQAKPSVTRVGVFTAPGDRVPGPRPLILMGPVQFPWERAIDEREEVGETDSFGLSMELSRAGLICGPSSGFNLKGLHKFLARRKAAGTLQELTGPTGEINCVFVCCDLPYQYLNDYFDKLDDSWFHPVQNRNLIGIDLYNNYEELERQAKDVIPEFLDPQYLLSVRSRHTIVDLRSTEDFASWHLPSSVNVPIASLRPGEANSPFTKSPLFVEQWKELESVFGDYTTTSDLTNQLAQDERVLVICHNGDTSRMASSILKAKGCNAESVALGVDAIKSWIEANVLGEEKLQKNTTAVEGNESETDSGVAMDEPITSEDNESETESTVAIEDPISAKTGRELLKGSVNQQLVVVGITEVL